MGWTKGSIMKAKEFIIELKKESKPRNFVAKNAKMGGAGQHKDKKKAEKQGDFKHKKSPMPMESALRDKEDYYAKRKALDDLGRNKDVDQKAVQQRRLDLDKEAKQKGVAEGANDMTPNWAKYVLDQIYNSNGAVTLTDLFDEGIPGLHDMFMATAEAHGLDPEEDFEDVQHELTVELEDLIKGGVEEGMAEGGEYNKFKVGQRAKFKASNGKEYSVIITAVDYDDDAVKFRSAENKPFPDGELEQEVDPGWKFLTPEPRVDPNSIIAVSPNMRKTTERVRDPEDWDEGNTEPPNNFAVYINGKKWKVFKGRGQFADDYKEVQHYRQLQTWAQQKSAATGKKWTVSITGEGPTA
jgi:hypothetical protein